MTRRYILTGGPGSGKSTLIQALGIRGYVCVEEASRQLIMEGLDDSAEACLPWTDLACFAEKVLQRMVNDYQATEKEGLVFFDRGIPDIIAYLEVGGLPVGAHFHEAMRRCRYEKTVFLLPPWRGIYVQEPARWQTFEESERLYHAIKKVYQAMGYRIKELPTGSVEERINFILD